jgi:hypothetical protein
MSWGVWENYLGFRKWCQKTYQGPLVVEIAHRIFGWCCRSFIISILKSSNRFWAANKQEWKIGYWKFTVRTCIEIDLGD